MVLHHGIVGDSSSSKYFVAPMLHFTEHSILSEVFDSPYPIREVERLGSGIGTAIISYDAKVDNGKRLRVVIGRMSSHEDPRHTWQIDFMLNDSTEMTNAGKPWRILATVLEAIRQFLAWYADAWKKNTIRKNPVPHRLLIVSKASEASREGAYRAMINRFGKQYGYSIASREVQGSGKGANVVMTLERKP